MNLENNPICDIIIVTWNGLEYTKRCVKSIEENTKDVDYRIIFVDNDSSDETVEFLKHVKNSILIQNEENLGFAKAMNIGFEKVSSKFTVWLNNDTIVTSNWLSDLINYLEKDPKIGAVGPVSNGTGIIQKVEGLVDDSYISIKKFGDKIKREFKNQFVEYHRIAGFCILMRSELILKVGLIDETFNHGGYDDDDYCKRIRDKGFKILIAEDVFIYHKSGASFSSAKDPDFHLQYLMPLGRRKLLRKRHPNPTLLSPQIEKKPLISIIMTTVNRKKIIKNAIMSVVNQTYENWELLVINDGGENIQNIIDLFDDSRIKYIHLEKNYGKSFVNNNAIENCNGKIIAYLDDDDRWYVNHLQLGINGLLINKNRKFVYFDYVKVDCIVDNELQEQFPIKKTVHEIQTARSNFVDEINFIPNFSMMHKKELFDLVGKYDTNLKYYEDWDMIRRFSYVTPFIHIPEITGEYWIDIAKTGRNASALHDKNMPKMVAIIKNKNKKIKNETLRKLNEIDSTKVKNTVKSYLKLYEEIYESDPLFYPGINGIAEMYFLLKKYEKAENFFKKMLIINPYRYSTYHKYAQNQIYQNKYSEAKSLLENALIIKDEKSAYLLLQECYKKLHIEKTSKWIESRTKLEVENINYDEVVNLLLNIYNKSPFYRKLMIFSYRILKRLN